MPGFHRVPLLFGLVLWLACPALAQEQRWTADSLATISVSGTAELEAAPDFIEWHIRIADESTDPIEAKENNDARYEWLLELADDVDIESEDIVVGPVSVERIYEWTAHGDRGDFKHYELRRLLVLIQRDFDDFDELLEKLAASGLEFRIEYSTTQVHAMKREARLDAVRVAREKAQEMAQALGQELGRPLEVVESSTRTSGFDMDHAISNTSSGGAGDGVGIRMGAISVRSRVEIVFELIQPE
ncbi:MAG: SIMPL domain-containing protein [Planctomycetota bacterium]